MKATTSIVAACLLVGPWTFTTSAQAQEPPAREKDPIPEMEYVQMPAMALALSKANADGATIRLDDFPIAPGLRETVVFQRQNFYAPGARVFVIEGKSVPREIPRSDHLHFVGRLPSDPTARVGLSMDPKTHQVRGLAISRFGMTEITAPTAEHPTWHRVGNALAPDQDLPLTSTCGSDREAIPFDIMLQASTPINKVKSKATALPNYTATIAVDTDNEFHHKKFSNNTTSANNYIADLFTAMNVFYERDLSLRLLQGDTFLRLDTDPSPTYDDDPYNIAGSGVSSAQLSEFASYWSSNMGGVERVFAMLLSGKSSNPFSASGRAYLNSTYCDGSGDYSVSQIFTWNFPASSDSSLVGHELGHNFGSTHTHCYNPPVDTCYALEGGCYNGAVSCPAGGKGTLMSYCHFSNGANCGSNNLEFHPTVAGLIDSIMTNNAPNCVMPLAALFDDGFESGNVTSWSSSSP